MEPSAGELACAHEGLVMGGGGSCAGVMGAGGWGQGWEGRGKGQGLCCASCKEMRCHENQILAMPRGSQALGKSSIPFGHLLKEIQTHSGLETLTLPCLALVYSAQLSIS